MSISMLYYRGFIIYLPMIKTLICILDYDYVNYLQICLNYQI
jgi:hypothetical protein